jgi:hypothetical protein
MNVRPSLPQESSERTLCGMDWVSWIIIAAVIVFAAVGLAIWNRAMRRSSPVDQLDDAARKEVLEAQRRVEQSKGDLGNMGGAGMG